jgi:CRISPR type IV-associated protein Csf3
VGKETVMQPLQITAHLAGSISLARPQDLALDGILAVQVMRRHYGNDFYTLPDPSEHLMFARLPLVMRGKPTASVESAETGYVLWDSATRTRDESLWYWSCSAAQIDVHARDTQYWNKRFDTQPGLSDHIDFGGKVEKIIIEQGRYKAYHMPLPTLVTDKVTWYAYGEREAVANLLQGVSAIGKKRVQGNGYCLRWDVEPIADDWSEWRDDQLMRPLPGPLVDAEQIRPLNMEYIAFRAPQWHPLNQAMCVTKAVLHG